MIQEAFAKKRLSVLTQNDYEIRFVEYWMYDLIAVIDNAEIKPFERNKGYAKK